LLCNSTRSEDGINDGVAAHFGQVHAAHLRKGTLVLAAAHAAKIERIGRGISYLIQGAIDGHEPQPEAKGPFALLRGHRSANALEEVAQHRRPQLPPAIHQRRGRRQAQTRVRPQPAQPTHQVTQDRCQVEPTKQGERNDVINDQELVEAALARSPRMAPGQQFAHQLRRTQLLEHFKAQGLAKLAVISQLLYAQSHERFLSSLDYTIRLVLVYQKMNSLLI
jgi:hypothetical protein